MKQTTHAPAPLLLALALPLALAGCGGGKTETTITTQDGQKVTVTKAGGDENATITAVNDKGETATITTGNAAAGGKLPGGVGLYPGAKQTANMMGEQDGKTGGVAVLETSDAPDKVVAYYKAEAQKLGFTKNVSNMNTTSDGKTATTFTAEGADGKSGIVVTATADGGKTTVTIMGGQQ